MRVDFQHDVFQSCNSADKSRVPRLAHRLRAAGLRVWFDAWIRKPGGSPRPSDGRGVRGEGLAIERRLEASRTLVLCLSPAALGSDWVGLERSTVLFRDPANVGLRFIPFLVTECDCPNGASSSSPCAVPRAYLHSDYCVKEILRVFALDPDFSKGVVLPLSFEDINRTSCLVPSGTYASDWKAETPVKRVW
ncbi:MAG: toll/interleukin-1 receptor domain-containing protein [Verrucomicrobia bacterium]|nr:toll/interleukin-1 receptor domain-containing protein [Verrucomicrobiota bacterium]